MIHPPLWFLGVLTVSVWTFPVLAEEPPVSPARARAALAAGAIQPLAVTLSAVEVRYAGTVVEAELHESGKTWTYEFEILPDNGHLYRVFVNATTGAVTRTEGPAQERR